LARGVDGESAKESFSSKKNSSVEEDFQLGKGIPTEAY